MPSSVAMRSCNSSAKTENLLQEHSSRNGPKTYEGSFSMTCTKKIDYIYITFYLTGYRPRFVHTRPTRSLSVEFEGQIYDIDLQADDRSAVRPRIMSKRHDNPGDSDFDLGSDDGSEEMLADDTNAVGYPSSVKVTHK